MTIPYVVPVKQLGNDDCDPCSVKMSLESALRHFNGSSPDFELRYIAKKIGYEKGGTPLYTGIAPLNNDLKKKYGFVGEYDFVPDSGFGLIKRLLEKNKYPVATLLFRDIANGNQSYDLAGIDKDNTDAHSFVIIKMDDKYIYTCDPLEDYDETRFDANNPPKRVRYKIPKFLRAWEDTSLNCPLLWFEPIGKPSSIQRTLEDDDHGRD